MSATHYCIICGREFVPVNETVVLCPNCGGPPEAKISQLEPGDTLCDAPDMLSQSDGANATLNAADMADGEWPLGAKDDTLGGGSAAGFNYADEDDVPAIWHTGDVILDLYEVTGKLGEGGFGMVYSVHHRTWNLDLAVKSPNAEALRRAGTVEDFVSEAESWMDLGLHPHIVTCHYVRTLGGIPRVFAELVEGGSLSNWIRDGRLYAGTPTEVLARMLDVAIQFAWGLHYAHEQGMIHQDVKPANVLLTAEDVAKVTDFGLVRARALETTSLPRGGSRLVRGRGMTPAYCSPEQAVGHPLSRRTDLWSWGLSVLEMFAGRAFWVTVPGATVGQLAPQALEHYAAEGPAVEGIPAMPGALQDLLREIFREDPDARPHDLQLVAERLQEIYHRATGQAYFREQPEAAELRADSLNNRALSLLDLAREDEAVAAWAQALRLDPHHLESTYNLGMLRWRQGSLADDELVNNLEIVQSGSREKGLASLLLGLVELERGDPEHADRRFVSAVNHQAGLRSEVRPFRAVARSQMQTQKPRVSGFQPARNRIGVRTVRLLAGGQQALTADTDGDVRLWDLASGELQRVVVQAPPSLLSFDVDAKEQLLVTGGGNGRVRVWDLQTGECLRELQGHHINLYVTSVCFSADGMIALSGSWDRTVRLWDVSAGRCLSVLSGHKKAVECVCLSADRRLALTGSMDCTLRLWDLQSGRCLRVIGELESGVSTAALSTDGRLAIAGVQNTLQVWDVSTGERLRSIRLPRGAISAVTLSADGQWAVTGSHEGALRLWDLTHGRCLRTYDGHESAIRSICLHAELGMILSGDDNSLVKVWHTPQTYRAPLFVAQPKVHSELAEAESRANQLIGQAQRALERRAFHRALACVKEARAIPGYERDPGVLRVHRELSKHCPHVKLRDIWLSKRLDGHMGAACVTPDGSRILAGTTAETLQCWDVASGDVIWTSGNLNSRVTALSVSANGEWAVSGTYRSVQLWDVFSGSSLWTSDWQQTPVNDVALSRDGRLALSVGSQGWDNAIRVWDTQSGQCVQTLEGLNPFWEVEAICLSTDERFVLSGSRALWLWDVTTGELLQTIEGGPGTIRALCLSSDGTTALSGSGAALVLWDLSAGCRLSTMTGHEHYITAVAMTADGRYAVSGAFDKTCRLWDLQSGQCVKVLKEHAYGLRNVGFSSDAQCCLTSGDDKQLLLWTLDWELSAPLSQP